VSLRPARWFRRALSLEETALYLLLAAVVSLALFTSYNTIFSRSKDDQARRQLSEVASVVNRDFTAARNWTEAFESAASDTKTTVVLDDPAAPRSSSRQGEVSFRATGRVAGLAMRATSGRCVMAFISGGDVETWLVKEDIGTRCAGSTALQGNLPAQAYTGSVAGPAAPTGLTATPGDISVTLEWSGTAQSFEVLRDGSAIGRGTSPYMDRSVKAGESYSYSVRAVSTTGESSASAGPVTALLAPPAPTGVAASWKANLLQVSWSESSGAVSGYRLTDEAGVELWAGMATTTSLTVAVPPAYVRVAAYNATGSSAPSPLVRLGGALASPSALTVTPGDRVVVLAWAAPASGAVSGYEVLRNGSVLMRTRATSAVVSGLTNGTPYSFAVRAYSSSAVSSSTMALEATPGSTPDSVTGLAAVQCSSGASSEVALTWTNPSDDPDNPLLGVKVYDESSGALKTTARAPLTTTTVSGLTPGSTYSFGVTTWRTGGLSGSSSVSVTAACPPASPVTPTVTVTGATTASGAFSTPDNGGSPINLYEYRCVSRNGGSTVTAQGTTSPLNVTGLTAGKTYSCMAYARNAIGYSSGTTARPTNNASVSNPDTDFETILQPNTPGAPTLGGGDGSMSVAWSAVAETSSQPLTGYRVYLLSNRPSRCSDSTSCALPTAGTASCTTAATSCTITGLTNGVTYSVYVQAYNSTFYSDGVVSSYLVYGPPPTPSLSATQASTSSIALSAAASSTAGTPVSGFYFYRSGTHIGTTASGMTDTGRAAGTQYCYTAVAYNSRYSSPASASSCAYTAQNTPAAPTAYGFATTGFGITWTALSGSTSYDFEIAGVGTWNNAYTLPVYAYLSPCTWYTTYIRAKGPWGTTGWSPSITVQTRCNLSITDGFDSVQGYGGTSRWPTGAPYHQTASAPNPTKYMTFGYDQYCSVCTSLFHYSAGLYFTGAPNSSSHPNIRDLTCKAQIWPTGHGYGSAYEWALTTGNGVAELHYIKYSSATAMRTGSRPSIGRGSQITASGNTGTKFEDTMSAAECLAFYNGTYNGILVGPYTNSAGTPINQANSGGVSFTGRLALASEGGNYTPRIVYTGTYGGSG
jgi:hypothetical protein